MSEHQGSHNPSDSSTRIPQRFKKKELFTRVLPVLFVAYLVLTIVITALMSVYFSLDRCYDTGMSVSCVVNTCLQLVAVTWLNSMIIICVSTVVSGLALLVIGQNQSIKGVSQHPEPWVRPLEGAIPEAQQSVIVLDYVPPGGLPKYCVKSLQNGPALTQVYLNHELVARFAMYGHVEIPVLPGDYQLAVKSGIESTNTLTIILKNNQRAQYQVTREIRRALVTLLPLWIILLLAVTLKVWLPPMVDHMPVLGWVIQSIKALFMNWIMDDFFCFFAVVLAGGCLYVLLLMRLFKLPGHIMRLEPVKHDDNLKS